MKINCMPYAAMLIGVIFFMFSSATARNVSVQPRLELGIMYYEFESEASSVTWPPLKNRTQSTFEYNDCMPVASAGATLFMDRFFLDINGQYAWNGQDRESMIFSMYSIDSYDSDNQFLNSSYVAFASENNVKIHRHDIAVSLGYALTQRFSIFGGYKWAETQFDETFSGPYSLIEYNADNNIDDIDYTGGRWWGEATYRFENHGPFIGFIQGWEFSDHRLLNGMLTANVALAFLEGKVISESVVSNLSITMINDQQIPEYVVGPQMGRGLSSRDDTKGDALGLTVGIGWRGATPWEGLSYSINISSYRYEFDSKSKTQNNINETAVTFKLGLAYIF